MGRKPTSGGVRPKGERIEVRFMWQGKQIAPTLNLKPNAANLKHAAKLRETILHEIGNGVFQFSRHFPDYKHRAEHQALDEAEQRTFGQWADVWEKLSARTLEHSTLDIYKRHMKAYWRPVFNNLLPARISHEMILGRLSDLASDKVDDDGKVTEGLGRKTQNNIMIPLRGVFGLICRPPSQLANPTEGIDNLKNQKAEPDPFEPEEVEKILSVMRAKEGDELADYFEFSFFTGLRPSEQVALCWADVDLKAKTVMVRRVRVLAKDKDRTKTHVARVVELNDRAAAVIERQRARTQVKNEEVFWNPHTGKIYRDEQTQRLAWTRVLKLCGVRYRPPKECRDTSVSMSLMSGAYPVWVAAQHGHSVTVMMKDYAKWIPKADRGANIAAVNRAQKAESDGQKQAI
jgi:integrase